MSEQAPDPDELKDAFKCAAEIAAVVPEAMQEAAFNRALDQILGVEEVAAPRQERSQRAKTPTGKPEAADHAQQLIDGINRTAYPEVAASTKVLDRALAVLGLAANDFDIDGLTAPDIAKVLTEKFRLRTTRQAVTQALGAAHTMVDTNKRGQTTVYRIMQAGEDHLQNKGEERQGDKAGTKTRTRKRRQPARQTKSTKRSDQKSAAKRTTRRRGPKAAVGELIDEGFFSEPRTMNSAQEQLRHKKGLRFAIHELSPGFVRLLREGRLDRDRNESGQYEYRSK